MTEGEPRKGRIVEGKVEAQVFGADVLALADSVTAEVGGLMTSSLLTHRA